jgi:hypothetical protein
MTILESIAMQVSHHVKGAQIFNKDDLVRAIKEHNIVFANDIKIDEDEQGEHLILTYDDQIVCLQLTWRQEGPRHTLVAIQLA